MHDAYTITERDFYRDAWAYTYPTPYGFAYSDALAIVLTDAVATLERLALRVDLPQEDR